MSLFWPSSPFRALAGFQLLTALLVGLVSCQDTNRGVLDFVIAGPYEEKQDAVFVKFKNEALLSDTNPGSCTESTPPFGEEGSISFAEDINELQVRLFIPLGHQLVFNADTTTAFLTLEFLDTNWQGAAPETRSGKVANFASDVKGVTINDDESRILFSDKDIYLKKLGVDIKPTCGAWRGRPDDVPALSWTITLVAPISPAAKYRFQPCRSYLKFYINFDTDAEEEAVTSYREGEDDACPTTDPPTATEAQTNPQPSSGETKLLRPRWILSATALWTLLIPNV